VKPAFSLILIGLGLATPCMAEEAFLTADPAHCRVAALDPAPLS
jgi:hypothetical protein